MAYQNLIAFLAVCLLAFAQLAAASGPDSTEVEQLGAQESAAPPAGIHDHQNAPSKNISIIQQELKSAKQLAAGGAIVYGIGAGVEVVGEIIFINDVMDWAQSESDGAPPMGGLYVALAGGAASLGGSIACNAGGSKAHSVFVSAFGEAPSFKGWAFFGAGLGCSAGSYLLSMAQVPIVPTIISIGGMGLNLASVIYSCSYTSKLYIKSIVLHDLRAYPILDAHNAKPIGFGIAGSF
jgi:hypothetical protein